MKILLSSSKEDLVQLSESGCETLKEKVWTACEILFIFVSLSNTTKALIYDSLSYSNAHHFIRAVSGMFSFVM